MQMKKPKTVEWNESVNTSARADMILHQFIINCYVNIRDCKFYLKAAAEWVYTDEELKHTDAKKRRESVNFSTEI